MKNLLLIVLLVTATPGIAQIKEANLQAAGLTCALCSRSVNSALEKLTFVQSVQPELKSSSFKIVFKPGSKLDIDGLKKAVEDAGFSVASLKLMGSFNNVKVQNDAHIVIEGVTFHFVRTSSQVLTGEKNITLVDKNFINAKEFKKYSSSTKLSCIQTGKAGSCCTNEGIKEDTRIYHVTI